MGFSLVLPCSSFSVIVLSISGWLVRGSNLSKKEYDGILGFLCFVEHYCLLSAFEAISGLKGKPGLLGAVSMCAYLVTDLTFLPCT